MLPEGSLYRFREDQELAYNVSVTKVSDAKFTLGLCQNHLTDDVAYLTGQGE